MKVSSFEAIASALNREGVRYLVAGGLAVNAHGYVRLAVNDVYRLAREFLAMNDAQPEPQGRGQPYAYFSPWLDRNERDCRTCTYSIGWGEHHLFCNAHRHVTVYPCGIWERGTGCDAADK